MTTVSGGDIWEKKKEQREPFCGGLSLARDKGSPSVSPPPERAIPVFVTFVNNFVAPVITMDPDFSITKDRRRSDASTFDFNRDDKTPAVVDKSSCSCKLRLIATRRLAIDLVNFAGIYRSNIRYSIVIFDTYKCHASY